MRASVFVVAASALVLTACPVGPDPGPPPASWTTTRVATEFGPPASAHTSAWTDDHWFVTASGFLPLQVSELRFRPRSGPGGSVLGAPQVVPTAIPGALTLLGDHLLGARGFVAGTPAVEFFRETAGTWASGGVVQFPGELPVAFGGDWLVTRPTEQQLGQDSVLRVYAVDGSGPTVTATFSASLQPNPGWHEDLRSFYGTSVSIDGDLIVASAVQGASDADGAFPGDARVYRLMTGDWHPVAELGGAPGGALSFGASTAVDDGASVDRVVISHRSATLGGPVAPNVEIYADSGSGFALEQSLTPDPSLPPDTSSFGVFGNFVALDGDLLAVTSRWSTAPSSDPAAASSTVGYVQLYRRGATSWTREAEPAPFVNPVPSPITAMTPANLQVSGNHVAVTVFIGLPIPPTCTFPQICLYFTMEAWSIDRTA